MNVLNSALILSLIASARAFAPSRPATVVPTRTTSSLLRATSTTPTDEIPAETSANDGKVRETRILGSQELLMAPRQYSLGDDSFPSMNHVSCAILSATPPPDVLEQALEFVMESHPLLRAHIQGDGEPDKRIDLFQMVREGEPNPMTFVADKKFSGKDLLTVIDVEDNEALEASWKEAFAKDLDDGSWCDVHEGPMWKVELHRANTGSCALLLSFNHAISDQSSANRLTDQILRRVAEIESNKTPLSKPVTQDMPIALEDSVLGMEQRWSNVQTDGLSPGTISYVAGKAAEGFRDPVILPDTVANTDTSNPLGALTIISGNAAGGQDDGNRLSVVEFRSLSKDSTEALLAKCRENGVSISHALTAAVALTSADFIGEGNERNYKVLQSLDMRRFGEQLDQGKSVACMAGSMDLMHGPLPDGAGKALRSGSNTEIFWKLAKEGKEQTAEFVATDGPKHAVRVFDFAMTIADLNNLVYQTAQSKDTKGRAYSAGLTNVGVYERQSAFQYDAQETGSENLSIEHGKYRIKDVFFATPHVQSGCLYPVSCLTVDGEMKFTFNPVSPIVSEESNKAFADAYVELLEVIGGTKVPATAVSDKDDGDLTPSLPSNVLTTAAVVIGSAAVLSHAGAWSDFFASVSQMKANIEDPADFSAALNFWIFFAVGHPILQPILWISDVLHGSPGPKIADLVPATFLAGNIAVIYAIQKFKDLRNAVNIAALAAFFTYIGAGLDGTAGLGDYNLALDDSYKGQIVKGCPAYDEVRQPSMDNFDLNKYQGMWYEHKFHDWTQFKEVYDTSLGIKLTEGGKGWIDDFGVKGPAPLSAPKSWEASPVANGAHYFLFGRVDDKDPPGVLREKGFGVEFPNYIVDVKKDPATGDYTEAIQFQCLERGGVRVFEGINFMSRNEVMTDGELDAMHARAEKAGMYPYGASPEQMHRVAQRLSSEPDLDNSWQAMWRAIGLDKLLELLTESIEDGGR